MLLCVYIFGGTPLELINSRTRPAELISIMARKDATKAPPLDKYRKDIGKHDKRKGDKINKAEKRQR